MSKDYEIGYGKPPRQHQFKSGNQASRRRRKRKEGLSIRDISSEVLKRRRKIKRGDELIDMSVAQIVAEGLVQSVTQGSPRDVRTFMELLEKYAPGHLSGPAETLDVVYHRAPGSQVELPPAHLWKEPKK